MELARSHTERFEHMRSVMEGIIGEPMEESRTNRQVWARAIIADALYGEGLTTSVVGELLNRDHSTVSHYIGLVKGMVQAPVMYQWEYETYLDFMAAV